MMKTLFASLFAVCVAAGVVLAQTPPTQFEVATIKLMPPLPAGTKVERINLGAYYNGTLAMADVTLSEALRFAYDLTSEDQVSGPDWIKSRDTARYEVAARTAGDVTLAQARVLTQKLLADRLKVVIRKEMKPLSFMALVQAPGGSKLVAVDPSRPVPTQGSYGNGRLILNATAPVLALILSTSERQMILDRTGLTGRYQIRLEYLTEAPGAVKDQTKPPLASALQDQLGLRLESRREPLDAIIVERAEKLPIDN
jgi:uncharacterized protein (TIGR03435 family)